MPKNTAKPDVVIAEPDDGQAELAPEEPTRSFEDYLAAIPQEAYVQKFGEFVNHGLSANAKGWLAQRPHEPFIPILEMVEEQNAAGTFDRRAWDPNHRNHIDGTSNKLVKIWAGLITGNSALSMDAAWDVIEKLARGWAGKEK